MTLPVCAHVLRRPFDLKDENYSVSEHLVISVSFIFIAAHAKWEIQGFEALVYRLIVT